MSDASAYWPSILTSSAFSVSASASVVGATSASSLLAAAVALTSASASASMAASSAACSSAVGSVAFLAAAFLVGDLRACFLGEADSSSPSAPSAAGSFFLRGVAFGFLVGETSPSAAPSSASSALARFFGVALDFGVPVMVSVTVVTFAQDFKPHLPEAAASAAASGLREAIFFLRVDQVFWAVLRVLNSPFFWKR